MIATKTKKKNNKNPEPTSMEPYSITLVKPKKPLTIQKVLAPKLEILSPYSRVNKTVEHNGTEIFLGEVEDYYSQVRALSTTLKEDLSVGDRIVVRGISSLFMQEVESIQENRKSVRSAKKGKQVGIKTEDRCRTGDKIFKVV